jgi:hypothetical protein
MRPLAFIRWGVLGVLVVVGISLLAQLAGRAERSAQSAALAMAARENAAVIRTASGVTIQFDQLRRSDSLMRGWFDPEPPAGVWSDGREAVLKLPVPPAGGDLDVAFKLQPFLAPGLPAQRVVVRTGGSELTTWRLASGEPQTVHATVPRALRSGDANIELHLELPDADAPSHRMDSNDARLLAIRVQRVDLATVAADMDARPWRGH